MDKTRLELEADLRKAEKDRDDYKVLTYVWGILIIAALVGLLVFSYSSGSSSGSSKVDQDLKVLGDEYSISTYVFIGGHIVYSNYVYNIPINSIDSVKCVEYGKAESKLNTLLEFEDLPVKCD